MAETLIKLVDPIKFGDSPAKNSEAEDIMFQFAVIAASTGEWPTIPLDEIEANKDLYTGGIERMDFLSPTREGIVELLKSGMATKVTIDGKEHLTLTDRFKSYYSRISK